MLTIDEMLAPAAEDVAPIGVYTFDDLRGRPRLTLLPFTMRNPRFLNAALAGGIKAAAEDAEKTAEGSADEAASGIEAIRERLRREADMLADTSIAGFAVQEEPDGPHVPRDYTPELGRSFLRRLIDLPQGTAIYMAFSSYVAGAIHGAAKPALDPTATAGNSFGG